MTATDEFPALTVIPEEPPPDSWQPIDLGPYLRGEITPPTASCGIYRTDGIRLLYPGKEHAAIGEMECGKTWFGLGCAVAEIATGRNVVYVHFEESEPSGTVDRLTALGVPDDDILSHFYFVGPERPIHLDAIDTLLALAPALVIIDGVNEAMSLHRTPIRDEDGAAEFRRRVVKPFTAAGAAVLSLDHVVKDPAQRTRSGIGSVHKGNAITGSLIQLENAEPFGRQQRGRSHVFITKDRPGYLRQHGRSDSKRPPGWTYMGEFVVDATTPRVEMRFYAPKQPDTSDTPSRSPEQEAEETVFLAIVALTVEDQPVTLRRVRAKAGLQGKATDYALDRLVVNGRIKEETGPRNARIFTPATVSQDPTQSESQHRGDDRVP